MDDLKFTIEESEFIRESNAIEGVYDDQSFVHAMKAWQYIKGRKTLTVPVILKTHQILMVNQDIPERFKGHFREQPVYIGDREGKPYYAIYDLIQSWCARANRVVMEDTIKTHHIDYEYIHPFLDGNGRTGRLFMNWQRLKIGSKIMVIKESEKYEYYKWFKRQWTK